jgi:diguanylate cyclase (GGDEF)-like protein
VLSSDRPIRELFDGLSALLESYVDAAIVFIVLAGADGEPVASYLYLDGRSGEPDEGRLSAESTAARVFETGVPVRYERASDWPAQHLVALLGKTVRPEAAIFVPIVFGGERIGVLSVQSTIPGAYSEDDVVMLETCALYLGARINDEERRKTAERYERLATVDVLTGVANRSALDQALEREWRRACETQSQLSFLMIDVDFFKAFNDRYGHVAGDACLQQLAGTAQDCLVRPSDVFGRYGGEEFAVVLPDTGAEEAVRIAETMRGAVERRAIAHAGSSLGIVTISAGAATVRPKAGDEALALVRAADASLYEAKQRGRNRVAAEGYAGAQIPAEPREALRGNLPLPRTHFIGRGSDRARLVAAVAEHRLVTLIGPGGVGKTRVALEVARELGPAYPDGAWFVDLTAVTDAGELAAFVSSTLKGLVAPNREIAEVVASLRGANALLVLDNCEHLVEACAGFVQELLALPGGLYVLATSREALAVQDEFVYRIPPMEVVEGISLFVDRASNAGLTTAIEANDAIGEIVRQLDGLPLAIELAAPRLTTMSLAELSEGLGSRLSLLRSSSRRAPSRQQTLRALMDWSYRLLSPGEQTVLRRLAVFVGDWSREAAVAVCADGISEWEVGVALDGLIAKSLVQRESAAGEARLRMLEATREYAAEMLEGSDDAASTIARHAHTYSRLAIEAARRRERTQTTAWNYGVTRERGNLQAAMLALLDAREYEEASQMLLALRDWYWDRGSLYSLDLAKRIEHVLARGGFAPDIEAAFRLGVATILRRIEPQRMLALIDPARAHYRRTGDYHLVAASLRVISQAQLILQGCIDGELEPQLVELAERMEADGNLWLSAMLLNLLGTLHTQTMDDGRLDRARAAFDRAIGLLEARGDADRAGTLYGNVADVLFYLGDARTAMVRARHAVDLIEHSEEPWFASFQYMNLGHFATWSGEFDVARTALRQAYRGLLAIEGYTTATVIDKFARLAFATGQPERSAALLAASDAIFETHGIMRQRREATYVEQMRAELREQLGGAFDAAYRRGRLMKAPDIEAEAFGV